MEAAIKPENLTQQYLVTHMPPDGTLTKTKVIGPAGAADMIRQYFFDIGSLSVKVDKVSP